METLKLYHNGFIFTAAKTNPWVNSVITMGNKIVFTGDYSKHSEWQVKFDKVIDLNGKLMMPGFTDSHIHLMFGGFTKTDINLYGVKSKLEFQNRIKEYIKKNKSEFYRGGGWDHTLFENHLLPSKEWIDEIIPDRPVFLTRLDYHLGLANSKALDIANISSSTPNPKGGIIDKDLLTGEPTGLLRDKAMELLLEKLPERSLASREKSLNTALKIMSANGITSVHDISMKEDFDLYKKLLDAGKLTCRINSISLAEDVNDYSKYNSEFNNELLRKCLKAFADGSLGASTALFFEPYSDDENNFGLESEIFTSGKIDNILAEADENLVQIAIHAIGDRAAKNVLNLYSSLNASNGLRDRRARIEHCQHLSSDCIKMFKKFKIVASIQPLHLFYDGCILRKKLGDKRLKEAFPMKSLIDNGVKIIFGSDWPVVEPSVIKGIATAVTRKVREGEFENGFNNEQNISVEDAVLAYTKNPAYTSYEENIKGTIEVGKLADFVVLDKNIFNIDNNSIKDAVVERTVFNGETIFQKN